jgi:hypothetical protein
VRCFKKNRLEKMWVICELICLCLLKNGYGSHIVGALPSLAAGNSGSKHKDTKNCQASAARLIIWLHLRRQIRGKTAIIVCLHQAKKEIGRFPVGDINPRAAAHSSVSFVH